MIIVIADDITGAAEIAGAALKHKLNTILTIGYAYVPKNTQVWVIATDTRSMCLNNAIETIDKTVKQLDKNNNILYKKTDSALRGHIVAELNIILDRMGYSKALLLPQNPSKGRIIKNGLYYVNGQLIEKTQFKHDPEFPILSSRVTKILADKIDVLPVNKNIIPCYNKRILVAESSNKDEMEKQLHKTDNKFLFAGGVDFFCVLLDNIYPNSKNIKLPNLCIKPQENSIIVCGSTQSKDISNSSFIKSAGSFISDMPDEVFNGGNTNNWFSTLIEHYIKYKSLVITIKTKKNYGPQYAVRLRHIMAEAVSILCKYHTPKQIIIEGGSTAYSIINHIGWKDFRLKCEYSPGIVGMIHNQTEVILKPGSYQWGNTL